MTDKETSNDIVACKLSIELTFNDSAFVELPLICHTLSEEDEYFRAHQVCSLFSRTNAFKPVREIST